MREWIQSMLFMLLMNIVLLVPVLAGAYGTVTITGCDTLKDIGRTANDIGNFACELFGIDHPQEFERHVRTTLPPGAMLGDAEASGFDPSILCRLKEVVDPFIDDQLRLQQSMAVSLQRE